MATNILIYTLGAAIDEALLFHKLDAAYTKGSVLHLLGSEESNEPFAAWATANGHSFKSYEVNENKYGFSALQRAAKAALKDNDIGELLVHNIDAFTLEFVHLARDKGIKVVVF
jgi:hypothetical protein